ncbi:MAG: hypothetical protein HY587_00615 [Candidatus Omnitrophica bacterium]|nr:hypothetical protein [Candidatus Omnitrophota bacterium]
MRDIKLSTLVRKSIERAVQILFRPFDFKKWCALLLIVILSGGLGGGNSLNTLFPNRDLAEQIPLERFTAATEETSETDVTEETAAPADENQPAPETPENPETATDTEEQTESTEPPAVNPLLFILALILGLALSILFVWLSARFRFIWFNAVVQSSGAIREPFRRFQKEGNAVFKFLLIVVAGMLLYALLVLGLLFLAGQAFGVFKEGFSWSFGAGLVFALIALVFAVVPAAAISIFFVAFEDFIVPIMAVESCGFRPAWKSFSEIYGQNKKDFWIYLLAKIGLGIVTALLQLMLFVGWALIAMVAGAILFGIPYYLFSALFKLDALFWISAVILGIPYLAVFLLLLFFINLPFAAFFRSFSLYYLTSLKTKYTPLPLA